MNENTLYHRAIPVFLAIVLGASVFAGCTGSSDKQKELVNVKGSDTLLRLVQTWAEHFNSSRVEVSVTGGGSGTGIAALINGQIDIADASRPMKDSEKDEAEKNGVEPVEFRVAMDGIAVILNKNSHNITELTLEQIRGIYNGTYTKWSDVGGDSSDTIVLYGRQPNSGTYVFFQEHVLDTEHGGKDYSESMQQMNGNAQIVDSVIQDKNGIGYVGVSYAQNRENELTIVKVKKDENSSAYEPTAANVASGDYPISRFLFQYTNGKPTGAVSDFIAYELSDEGQKVCEDVEYIPLPQEIREEMRAQLG